jgi:hypothetical protein
LAAQLVQPRTTAQLAKEIEKLQLAPAQMELMMTNIVTNANPAEENVPTVLVGHLTV